MLVLHAAFHQGCLHLWGESSPPEEEPTTSQQKATETYPYRTTISVLLDSLVQADLSLQANG